MLANSLCLFSLSLEAFFFIAKEAVNKMKQKPPGWEKIFANEATNKELISKVYQQLIQLSTRKNEQPNQKMGRRSK